MSISYELARELKDAGFSQGGDGKMVEAFPVRRVGDNEWAKSLIYAPTLEELIEACGLDSEDDKHVGFYRLEWDCYDKEFRAHAGYADNHFTGIGKTLSEAVARLWLALNLNPPDTDIENHNIPALMEEARTVLKQASRERTIKEIDDLWDSLTAPSQIEHPSQGQVV